MASLTIGRTIPSVFLISALLLMAVFLVLMAVLFVFASVLSRGLRLRRSSDRKRWRQAKKFGHHFRLLSLQRSYLSLDVILSLLFSLVFQVEVEVAGIGIAEGLLLATIQRTACMSKQTTY